MRIALFALSLVLAVGCRPQIGDECVGSVDCSQQGDRLCDTSQPGGYCTAFNCEPDACPEGEAVCVAFGLELDPACQSQGYDPRWSRFERTFCMAVCEEDADCRDGYVCLAPSDRAAVSIDDENELKNSKVCFVAEGGGTQPLSPVPSVCGS